MAMCVTLNRKSRMSMRVTLNKGLVVWVGLALLVNYQSVLAQGGASAVTPGVGTPAPTVQGQVLNLQQCIDQALQNNIQIRQGRLTVENADLQLKQAQYNLYPNANFNANQQFSNGRIVDPFTNIAGNQQITQSSYQLNAQVTLYNGGALKNTIRQNDLTLQATQRELQGTQNNVALTVAQNYLNVLTGQEQLVIARRQLEVTQAQLNRTQRLVDAGSLPEGNLYDLRAQVAQNEVDIVNAQNTLDLAKLGLLQAMNVPAGQTFEVQPINVPDPSVVPYPETVQQVYETALSFLPDIQGADLRVKAAATGVDVARASLYPTVGVNANLSSFYSSAARTRSVLTGEVTQEVSRRYFIRNPTDNSVFPILENVLGTTQTRFSYANQIENNFNQGVALFLRVPIFGNFQGRTRIASARIQQRNTELQGDNVRLQVRQQIEQAYTNLRASANRYTATRVQVTSLEQAFRIAESRFNAGAVNSVDYNIAKTNLDRTKASLVQAKYDYVFRTKILDFYQNKPLAF